jgi:hypothetical protein
VIQAGTSFSTAISFILLGAALGAAGATALKQKSEAATATQLAAGEVAEAKQAQLSARVAGLAGRVKSLAGKAKTAAVVVGTTVGPRLKNAFEEGKKAAHATTQEIETELENDPDTVFAAEGVALEDEAAAEAVIAGAGTSSVASEQA